MSWEVIAAWQDESEQRAGQEAAEDGKNGFRREWEIGIEDGTRERIFNAFIVKKMKEVSAKYRGINSLLCVVADGTDLKEKGKYAWFKRKELGVVLHLGGGWWVQG